NFERLTLVARAAAGLARHPDVGQEVHFVADLAEAVALVAAAAGAVEAESVDRVPADFALRQSGEQLADEVKDAGVSGGIGQRRALPSVSLRRFIERDGPTIAGHGDRRIAGKVLAGK